MTFYQRLLNYIRVEHRESSTPTVSVFSQRTKESKNQRDISLGLMRLSENNDCLLTDLYDTKFVVCLNNFNFSLKKKLLLFCQTLVRQSKNVFKSNKNFFIFAFTPHTSDNNNESSSSRL